MRSEVLRSFAHSHRLKIVRADDGEPIVRGKCGMVSAYSVDRLAVLVLLDSPRRWRHRLRNCELHGMVPLQVGDCEGSLLFDPSNATQVALALKVAGIRQRKKASVAQLEVLSRGRQARAA